MNRCILVIAGVEITVLDLLDSGLSLSHHSRLRQSFLCGPLPQ